MTRPVEITEAYVKSLSDPLVTYTTEPIDTQSVLAIAVQAALWEAWEQIEHGETHLRMFPDGLGTMTSHGEIMAGKRVIRRIAETLDLMRQVPPRPTTGIARVMTWDWREQPDIDDLGGIIDVLSGGALHVMEPDTDSDEHALVISTVPLDADQAKDVFRRWWVSEDEDGDRLDEIEVGNEVKNDG